MMYEVNDGRLFNGMRKVDKRTLIHRDILFDEDEGKYVSISKYSINIFENKRGKELKCSSLKRKKGKMKCTQWKKGKIVRQKASFWGAVEREKLLKNAK